MISKKELLREIRKDLPVKNEEKDITYETLSAPPLKETKFIKDCCKVGEVKFFNWLINQRHTGRFKSHTQQYNKTYKILSTEYTPFSLMKFTVKIVEDEDPNSKCIGNIIELNANEIVDLVGEEYFKLKRGG